MHMLEIIYSNLLIVVLHGLIKVKTLIIFLVKTALILAILMIILFLLEVLIYTKVKTAEIHGH